MNDIKVKTMAEFFSEGIEPDFLFGLVVLEVLMIELRKLLKHLLRF